MNFVTSSSLTEYETEMSPDCCSFLLCFYSFYFAFFTYYLLVCAVRRINVFISLAMVRQRRTTPSAPASQQLLDFTFHGSWKSTESCLFSHSE